MRGLPGPGIGLAGAPHPDEVEAILGAAQLLQLALRLERRRANPFIPPPA